MYKYLLFDLDGTLLDTREGVEKSVVFTLKHFGKPIPSDNEIKKYLGPPLRDSFRNFAGFDEAGADMAALKFRERYDVKGIYEYVFFEQLPPSLEKLREKGFTLAVATSKIEDAARKMLEHAGIAQYFSFIGGATRSTERVRKADVIEYVLDAFGSPEKSEVLMIGDRENDVLGAHEVGIACCGLLCGYGESAELADCGADFTVPHISDLPDHPALQQTRS